MRTSDPDIALYDAACNLLDAAQTLHRMAERADSVSAIAPTLGCLQAAVHALECTYATLRTQARAIAHPAARDVRHSLDDTAAVLRLADRAAESARAAAAHVAQHGEAPGGRAPDRRMGA